MVSSHGYGICFPDKSKHVCIKPGMTANNTNEEMINTDIRKREVKSNLDDDMNSSLTLDNADLLLGNNSAIRLVFVLNMTEFLYFLNMTV